MRPRAARVVASTAALAATAWVTPAPAAHVAPLCDVLGIARRLDLGSGAVGLTFDDGPHPQGTPAVLDALAAARAQATFFVVGDQLRAYASLAGEIVAAGHRLAVHGDRHVCTSLRTPRGLRTDLDRCAALVSELAGAAPDRYRPPFGIFSPLALADARRRGWTPLLWSTWGRDWAARATPARIAERATRTIAAGDVVLLHDADHYSAAGSWQRTAAALPQILDELARRGLHSVAV
ncbi:MAG TPA: polysaccharide deacetylase family protein [Solirubrobacteraceae bacterium]|jgi:peptidoglycan/xylan/chitin deacetylase (PgdA/CDA1 family)|nr:polysaccharide deacetylase family protein [Solirubrobacteraceae bacterium]